MRHNAATMRLTFLILLLANLGLFVWSAGYLGERTGGREPGRLAVQLSPGDFGGRPRD